MKYQKFIIKNFKGIENLEFCLAEKPEIDIFTLVGLNESGKTSILEAIDFFYNGVYEKKEENLIRLIPKKSVYLFDGDISVTAIIKIEKADKKSIKEKIAKEFAFLIDEVPNEIEITRKINFKKNRYHDTGAQERKISKFSAKGTSKKLAKGKLIPFGKGWRTDKIDKFNNFFWEKFVPEIIYYENFLFNFPKKIFLNSEWADSEEKKKINKKYLNILDWALKFKDEELNIKDDVLHPLQKNDETSKQKLKSLNISLKTVLERKIINEWNAIFNKEKNNEKKTYGIEISWEKQPSNSKKYTITLNITRGEQVFDLSEKSLGFRWFFSYLFFTVFHKVGESSFKKTLFLFDEPASNLHQSLQEKLKKKFVSTLDAGHQIIYSTHSSNLIIPKFLSNVYIVINKASNPKNPENDWQDNTEIEAILYRKFSAQFSNQISHFQPILDALEYKPNELELTDYVVMVEGKIDYYLFRYMNEIIFKKKNKIKFYPGSGADCLNVPIRLYTSWTKNFLALLDSDKHGIKAKEKYKKDIGKVISNKIFSLDDICGQWKNFKTENLFLQEDQKNIIKKVFGELNENDYQNKNKLSSAIQEIWAQKESIKISKESKSNFEKVFNFIAKKKEENCDSGSVLKATKG